MTANGFSLMTLLLMPASWPVKKYHNNIIRYISSKNLAQKY
jgi:hypothetical protein